MRVIPPQAIELIRNFEGCWLHQYRCPAGILTIGIGHAIKLGENFTGGITQSQAEDILRADMQNALHSVLRLITRPLNDNQFSALLSFTFNLGGGALQASALRKKCNRMEDDDVPVEFAKWDKMRDPKTKLLIKSKGLSRRRKAEAMLYMAE